jgi:hypothetical protein
MAESFEFKNQGITILDSTPVSNATTASLVLFGGASIFNTTAGSGPTSGALAVWGDQGVLGTFWGTTTVQTGTATNTNTTESVDLNTGSIVTAGGVAIAKNLRVGGDTIITGSLNVNGTVTSILSTVVSIADNVLTLNSGPAGTRDAGLVIDRFQEDNNIGSGDVVAAAEPTAATGTFGTSNTTTNVNLGAGASATNDFYKKWWVLVTSGAANNNVRQILAYNGTTKVATLSSALQSAPTDDTDTYSLYNRNHITTYYNSSTNEYVFGYTANDAVDLVAFGDTGLLKLRSSALYTVDSTITNLAVTNISTGSIAISGATISNLKVTNFGTVNNLYSNNTTIGSLWVNNRNVTPSNGDIVVETSFAASNNQSSPAAVTGLAFANATVRSFEALVSVYLATTGGTNDRAANFVLKGVQKATGWSYNSTHIGEDTGVVFSVNNSGQVNYTSQNNVNFVSNTFKFKAATTTV